MVQILLNGISRIDQAVLNLQYYEPKDGYYLAFSGGKDSIVIYHLAKKAGVRFDAHFSQTTLDPPEVQKFIKDYYPDVIWEKPKKSFFKMIVDHGMLPTRRIRYCCRELKEIGGKGRVVITGIRRRESTNRRNRKLFDESTVTRGKFFLNPIVEWTENDVWDYIKENKIPYCNLYNRGRKRLGCLFCPMQNKKGRLKDIKEYPKYYRAINKAIQKMIDNNKRKGITFRNGETVEDIWEWWLSD